MEVTEARRISAHVEQAILRGARNRGLPEPIAQDLASIAGEVAFETAMGWRSPLYLLPSDDAHRQRRFAGLSRVGDRAVGPESETGGDHANPRTR